MLLDCSSCVFLHSEGNLSHTSFSLFLTFTGVPGGFHGASWLRVDLRPHGTCWRVIGQNTDEEQSQLVLLGDESLGELYRALLSPSK